MQEVTTMQTRPQWVMDLGPYGRAAYEWDLRVPKPQEQPATYQALDREVGDRVKATHSELAQIEELADHPMSQQLAAEIGPCLALVFARPERPLHPGERRLLESDDPSGRPSPERLKELAVEITEALTEGLALETELAWTPTHYFPAEISFLNHETGQDLYLHG